MGRINLRTDQSLNSHSSFRANCKNGLTQGLGLGPATEARVSAPFTAATEPPL